MQKRPLNSNKNFKVIKGGNNTKRLLKPKIAKLIFICVISLLLFFVAVKGINSVRDYMTARMLEVEYVQINSINQGIYGTGLYIRDEKVIASSTSIELVGSPPPLTRVRKGQLLGTQGSNEVVSPMAGLLIYTTDDYEHVKIDIEDRSTLSYFDNVDYEVKEVAQKPKSGDKLLKIVNNYYIDIFVRLDVHDAMQIWDEDKNQVMDKVRVKLSDGDNSLVKWMDIKGSMTHGDFTLVHLFTDEITDDFVDVRFSDVFFILDSLTGIKLPQEVLVAKQGETGIYSLYKNKVVFREIVLLKEEGDYVWVAGLRDNQAVILNPGIVKIGQRIKF